MANWCRNWCDVVVNTKDESYERFTILLELYKIKANLHNVKQHGVHLFDEPLFDVEFVENEDESFSCCIYTKWSPIKVKTIKQLLEKMPCVAEVVISFEEPGNGVYGQMQIERDDDFQIECTKREPKQSFFHAVKMRDGVCQGKFTSIKDAAERCEITSKEVESVLAMAELKLEDFNEDMECFDVENYLN